MTLKRQFKLLTILTTAIPFLCLIFIVCEQHIIHSFRQKFLENSAVALINEDKMASFFEKERVTDNETNSPAPTSHILSDGLIQFIQEIPQDVEYALLSADTKYVYISTIPEFQEQKTITVDMMQSLIKSNADSYVYQMTRPQLLKGRMLFLTRTPKQSLGFFQKYKYVLLNLALLLTFILTIVTLTIMMIRNMNKSIQFVQEETTKLADGKLDKPLITDSSDTTHPNEITLITESLEKMRKSLLDIQDRRNKFAMGFSHDLRTPVAVIKGYTEALLDEIICEKNEVHDTLVLIKAKTGQLESMIDSLISFMKIDYDNFRGKMIPGSINELFDSFSKDAEISGRVFKKRISTSNELTQDFQIPMDKQLVLRALENLYMNALRYTEDGDFIMISAENDSKNIYLKVCDTGLGIEKQDLNKIFDMFYRGTNSRREEGMGIGLSVVKNIIDIHNWKIEVESERHIGTYFKIIIPIPAQEDETPEEN